MIAQYRRVDFNEWSISSLGTTTPVNVMLRFLLQETTNVLPFISITNDLIDVGCAQRKYK